MRILYYTAGSPFARAIRILLEEKGLDYERREELMTGSIEDRAKYTPTLQVPTLLDGDLRLWDSLVIADYLMATYSSRAAEDGEEPLADRLYRFDAEWSDKLLLATILTLGESAAVVSQMRWTGVTPTDNDHVARNLARVLHLASWLEEQLGTEGGFQPGCLSVQDIFLTCFLAFIENRPLGIAWRSLERPRIAAMCDRLQQRSSFKANPILWWEPGVIGYENGQPIYADGRTAATKPKADRLEPSSP